MTIGSWLFSNDYKSTFCYICAVCIKLQEIQQLFRKKFPELYEYVVVSSVCNQEVYAALPDQCGDTKDTSAPCCLEWPGVELPAAHSRHG